MPGRINIPERIVEHIAVAIQRLRIGRTPWHPKLLPLTPVKLEPEPARLPEGMLAVHPCDKAGLMDSDGQRGELRCCVTAQRRRATPAARRTPRHDAVRRD